MTLSTHVLDATGGKPARGCAGALTGVAHARVERSNPTTIADHFSAASVLFADHIRYDPSRPKSLANDRFVLSKGHASPLLYSIFKALGVINDEELLSLRRGVCQDFAHLQIACLRSLGLAARFVSGYIYGPEADGAAPPGGRRTQTWAWYAPVVVLYGLALLYGACFGVEITIHNIAALYFVDTFGVGLKGAGLIVGIFGLLAIFARTLGGWSSDHVSRRFGLGGRTIEQCPEPRWRDGRA